MSAGKTAGAPISFTQRLHVAALYFLPHHLISRCLYWLTRRRLPGVGGVIRWFVRTYAVELNEAEQPDPAAYPTFNAFFTRALQRDARALIDLPGGLISPVDATVSEMGPVMSGSVLQAKGMHYTLAALLGGEIDPDPFVDGVFATLDRKSVV